MFSLPIKLPAALLQAAIAHKDLAACEQLLKEGVSPNARGIYGNTPLMWTTMHLPCLDICKALLEAGAEVNARDEGLATALMGAAAVGCADTCRLLIAHGALIELIEIGGDNALLLALKNGSPEAALVLIEAGARLDAQDSRGMRAMDHMANHFDSSLRALGHCAIASLQDQKELTALLSKKARPTPTRVRAL